MQDIKIKLDYMFDALTEVAPMAWVRLACLVLAWTNVGVALFLCPGNVAYIAISFAIAVVATVVAFWKNNSFTHAAQRADKYVLNKETISKFLVQLSGVSVGTWTRTMLMILTLINVGLAAFNKPLIEVKTEEIYTIVSVGLAGVVGLLNYWKNNSFTKAAQEADRYLHEQAFPDEDSLLDFDNKFGIDDILALDDLLPVAIKDTDDFKKFEFAAEKILNWAEKNPDKVKDLEEKLQCSLVEFVGKVRDKAKEINK